MSTDPQQTLHHAVDVTVNDAWAVIDFLVPRLEALERDHAGGTEEHRTATALSEAVSVLVMLLESEIRGRADRREEAAAHQDRGVLEPALRHPSPLYHHRVAEAGLRKAE
ncbi:hypothetical protein ABZ770_13340 [Streptomyces sp. NPDC006654]|uniref:hypothetical protein n=1 Tax=Streptomyces sp. NPDC006654 TaxID=3156897 RepID=UPI0033F35940